MAIIVNKLGGHITAEIPQIFDAVFECTLNMINKVSISLGTEGKWGVRKALVLACWYISWLCCWTCKWKVPFSCSEGRQIVVEFLDSFRLTGIKWWGHALFCWISFPRVVSCGSSPCSFAVTECICGIWSGLWSNHGTCFDICPVRCFNLIAFNFSDLSNEWSSRSGNLECCASGSRNVLESNTSVGLSARIHKWLECMDISTDQSFWVFPH